MPISWKQRHEATGALACIQQTPYSSVGLRKALSCASSVEGGSSPLGQPEVWKDKLLETKIERIYQEDDSSCYPVVAMDKFIIAFPSALEIMESKVIDDSDINPDWTLFELEVFDECLSEIVVLLRCIDAVETYPVHLKDGKWLCLLIYEPLSNYYV